jgi:hypothetical protein
MTVFNGWIHDKYNSKYMLIGEAVVGLICVILFTLILKNMKNKQLIPAIIE